MRGSVGRTLAGKAPTTCPLRPRTYLWKFHGGMSAGRWAATQR